MNVHIDVINTDLLKYIFGFLEDKQLFVIEVVNKKWQRCVRQLMTRKTTLKRLDYYSMKFTTGSWKWQLIVDNNNIHILNNILIKCPNIKHLNLFNTKVTGNNNLLSIAKLCTKLKSINLTDSKIDVSEDEMDEFGKLIGPQLIKLYSNIDNHNYYFNLALFKHFKNIEEVRINKLTLEQTELFHILNNQCKNLKVLEWKAIEQNIDYQNEDIIMVMKRIKHLIIDLAIILRFKFELDNLTELTIFGSYLDDEINVKRFVNVTKLNVKLLSRSQFELISKIKFPKLDYVNIIEPNNPFVIIPFINQINYIKSFEYLGHYLDQSIISQLNHLTNFVWKTVIIDSDSFEHLYETFENLLQHKSLQKITFEINDSRLKIDNRFYENLITLCNQRPNTEIIIIIFKSYETSQKFIDYKKLFEETKHLHKLNMFWEFS